jgi:aminopeptidase N
MHRIIHLIILLFLCFGASAQSSDFHLEQLAKAEGRQAALLRNYDLHSMSSNNFDVHFYRCEWIIDTSMRTIAGSVTSYFTITSAAASITYDLYNVMVVDSVKFRGAKILFSRAADALQINFPASLPAGQKDSVQIYYHGTPPAGNGYFARSTHAGTPILWTLSEPYGARSWWPCKDVLLDKADSIEIVITTPVAFSTSSNGLIVQETVAGTQRITRWKHRYPIVAYLVAIAVTNYVVDNQTLTLGGKTMPLAMHAYPESAEAFKSATATAKFCLQNFSPLISEYPFIAERYAQTQFPVNGGMEHQTNSFIGVPNNGLVAHELAHQWFGDKVTCGSWSDLWLNEGFASYMEYVYIELANPFNKINQLQFWRNNITSVPGGSVFVTDTLNIGRLFDGRLTYRKGAYLLHMLRWKLGDSTFFRGIRRYINDPLLAYKTARTADLQRNMEAESGQQLSEFFKDWLYGEGHPTYRGEWSKGLSTNVAVRLTQTTSHTSVPFYEMPVPLQFKNANRDTTIKVNHTRNGEVFNINPGFVPDTMIIDPQLWILSSNNSTAQVTDVAPTVDNELKIFPVPAKGTLTILLPSDTRGMIQFYNSQGQRIHEEKIPNGGGRMQIDTDGWGTGVYWLRIGGGNLEVMRKLLILH